MTVAEAIDAFLFHCRFEKNLSDRTLRAYATDLNQFIAGLAGRDDKVQVTELGKLELRAYIQQLFQRYGEKTIKRKIATLKALFGFLERDEVVARNPFRTMDVRIKETRRLPRVISKADLRLLFRHVYEELARVPQLSEERRVLVRDVALLEALFATGARVFEICSVRSQDVNLPEGWMKILGKGGRERVIHLCDPDVIAALYSASRHRRKHQPNHRVAASRWVGPSANQPFGTGGPSLFAGGGAAIAP
ncbi:MAG TPA: site-specific integrase [Longimicrobium sp.]|nr:site-specific integrase [Longimicrobium sp.]